MKNILTLLLLVLSLSIYAQKQQQANKQAVIQKTEYSSYDWFSKGYNAQLEKKYSDACFYYQKTIELKPDDVAAYNNWGLALTDSARKKDDEFLYYEGIEKYKKAIELKPDGAAIYTNWGVALVNLAKQKDDESLYYEGIEKCRKAIELEPDDEIAYNNWGAALVKLAVLNDNLKEKKDEIIELLNKADTLEYEFGSYNLACMHALMNEKETALAWLEKSLQYAKRDPREYYEQDADFNNIKEEPRFKDLLDKYFQNE